MINVHMFMIGFMFFSGFYRKIPAIKISITKKKNYLIIDTFNQIKSFQNKLLSFKSQFKNNNVQHFLLIK